MNTENTVSFNWRSPFDLNHPAGGMLSGLAAGLIAGAITGIAARLVMRIIALALGATPIFTIHGTLTILKDGTVFGIIVGIIFGFFQPFFPGSVIKRGAKLGLSLAVVMVILQYAGREMFAEAPLFVILPLFAILPLMYGVMLGWIILRLTPKDQVDDGVRASQTTNQTDRAG